MTADQIEQMLKDAYNAGKVHGQYDWDHKLFAMLDEMYPEACNVAAANWWGN